MGVCKQILASFLSSSEAFGELPLLDFCVISLNKHLGHLHAAKFPRSSELRVFEQSGVTEGVVAAAGFVVEDVWDEADYGVDDEHCGDLATIADEITDGNFEGFETLTDAVIKTFVAAAEDEQSGFVGELFDE